MKKFLIKLLFFIFFFVSTTSLLSVSLDYLIPKQKKEKMFWIFSKKNEVFDFAILGSSRAHNMLDVDIIEKETEKKGINIAHDGSGLIDDYLILQKFLGNNNKINNLIIQIDGLDINNDSFSMPFHDYLFLPFLKEDIINKTIKEESPFIKYFLWKYFPFTKYAEFNNIYKKLLLTNDKIDFDSSKGSKLLENADDKKLKEPEIIKYKISETSKKYLQMIIDLAKEKNINIIIYTAPFYCELLKTSDFNETNIFIQEISRKNNIKYLNFIENEISHKEGLFRDKKHLNKEGSAEFSKLLGESVKNALK